jgi:hypothetical protein
MASYLPIRHPWVDSSAAPIYQVAFPASATDEKLLSYCRAVESWSTQVAYPVAWLMDLSRVEQVSAQQRAIFAKFMEAMGAFDRRCTKATALILPNALLRGVATAIFWLYVPPFQHKTFADCSEGRAWLREMMGDELSDARSSSALVRTSSAPPSAPSSQAPRERASVRPNQGG